MMKNLLLLGLALAAGTGVANAQTARYRGLDKTPVPIKATLDSDAYFYGERTSKKAPTANNKTAAPGYFGTQIGRSWYDLPSNAAVANRIVRSADGTISAVWNETCSGPTGPTFPNRGAGYNYYNGTTWTEGATANPREFNGTCPDNFGVASKRVGWPEIMHVGTGTALKEVIITHNSSAINVTSRPTKGTGGISAWSTTTDLAFTTAINKSGSPAIPGNAGTWPRAVNSGNTIHMIYAVSNATTANNARIDGVLNPVVYSRSSDGGTTWDKQNIFLPGLDSVNGKFTRIGGDGYAIAANGNNVAIVAGYFGQPWSLWKSTDGGNTFVKRTIKRTATPADTVMISATDTAAMYNDNAHAVVIDNNGVVHVWAGAIFVKGGFKANGDFKPGDSWYPGLGADLLYWNDAKPANARPELIAGIEDPQPGGGTYIGFDPNKRTPYGTMGLVSMASGAFAANGDVYVIYDAVVRGTPLSGATGQAFRDLYIMKRRASDGKWFSPINISRSKNLFPQQPGSSAAEQGEESVFASVVHQIGTDNKLHATWMTDYEPGMNLGSDADAEGVNAIMYEAFDLNAFNFIMGTSKDVTSYVNDINAYPNPANNKVTLAIDLKKNASVKVRVTNVLGQEVTNIAPAAMGAGRNEVNVDMTNFANGIYLYTISSDEFTVTKRIVKQ